MSEMSFFRNQFANVVEWEEFRDDMIFWKWSNREIKRGSKLIIRPGQDAIFLYNGKVEGIFKDEGDYNIESEIIPFLSTLKGFKFGLDRKSTRLNSSHVAISYAVFCLKKKHHKPRGDDRERIGQRARVGDLPGQAGRGCRLLRPQPHRVLLGLGAHGEVPRHGAQRGAA